MFSKICSHLQSTFDTLFPRGTVRRFACLKGATTLACVSATSVVAGGIFLGMKYGVCPIGGSFMDWLKPNRKVSIIEDCTIAVIFPMVASLVFICTKQIYECVKVCPTIYQDCLECCTGCKECVSCDQEFQAWQQVETKDLEAAAYSETAKVAKET